MRRLNVLKRYSCGFYAHLIISVVQDESGDSKMKGWRTRLTLDAALFAMVMAPRECNHCLLVVRKDEEIWPRQKRSTPGNAW